MVIRNLTPKSLASVLELIRKDDLLIYSDAPGAKGLTSSPFDSARVLILVQMRHPATKEVNPFLRLGDWSNTNILTQPHCGLVVAGGRKIR